MFEIFEDYRGKKIARIITDWEIDAPMTNRQLNIWKSIAAAYTEVRQLHETTDAETFDAIFESAREHANNNELSTIHDIAYLFFLGMFKFGG